MKKNGFKLNQNVDLIVYNYDDSGVEYIRNISGKVCQITESFIVIDNGKYKECFKYSELYPQKHKIVKGEPYDLSIDNYKEDVINTCLLELEKKGKGFVFTRKQIEEVQNRIKDGKYNIRKFNEIYIIEKK